MRSIINQLIHYISKYEIGVKIRIFNNTEIFFIRLGKIKIYYNLYHYNVILNHTKLIGNAFDDYETIEKLIELTLRIKNKIKRKEIEEIIKKIPKEDLFNLEQFATMFPQLFSIPFLCALDKKMKLKKNYLCSENYRNLKNEILNNELFQITNLEAFVLLQENKNHIQEGE